MAGSINVSAPDAAPLIAMLSWPRDAATEANPSVNHARELDAFLASVEKRAFRIAKIVVRHDDDALDIVQDAMLQLARRYGQRPSGEWRPLFYRILHNRIRDCLRRRRVRARVLSWLPIGGGETPAEDPFENTPDRQPSPPEALSAQQAIARLDLALARLPARQREAFMLRAFEALDVKDTALAMGCSEGSVKTHYSRAVHALRAQLGEAWGDE